MLIKFMIGPAYPVERQPQFKVISPLNAQFHGFLKGLYRLVVLFKATVRISNVKPCFPKLGIQLDELFGPFDSFIGLFFNVSSMKIHTVSLGEEGEDLTLAAKGGSPLPVQHCCSVLAVDDNDTLLAWMDRVLTEEGFEVVTASSIGEAMEKVSEATPNTVVLDYLLPDGDGVSLAVDLLKQNPAMRAVVMSGAMLEQEDVLLCQRYDIPVLIKPFVAAELLAALDASSLKGEQRKSASS